MDDRQKEIRLAQGRLVILDAVVAVHARHVDVAAAIRAADDHRTAIDAVAELLGVEPVPARAVMDLPWWRLSAASRRQAERDRDEIRDWISDVHGSEAE